MNSFCDNCHVNSETSHINYLCDEMCGECWYPESLRKLHPESIQLCRGCFKAIFNFHKRTRHKSIDIV